MPVGAHPGGDDHGLGHHPAPDPGLAVGRVQEHVGEPRLGQRPVTKRPDLLIQARADPRDLTLGDPGVGPQGLDQVIDLPGADPVQVGLHHDREQGLVDPAAPLEQRGEERPGAQLGDPQVQVPGRRRQHPVPRPVAQRCAGIGALPGAGADHRRRLGVDQLLIQALGRGPDPVADVGVLQCGQQVEQGRLVHSHRAMCPSVSSLVRSHRPSHDGLLRRGHHDEAERELHHLAGRHPTRGGTCLRRTPENTLRLAEPTDGRTPGALLKRALLAVGRAYECETCEIGPTWEGATLVLEVDHINGLKHDNRAENLRFLCPNCHSQTPTRRRARKVRSCAKCGIEVSKAGALCLGCYDADERRARVRLVSKVDWPGDDALRSMVHGSSYSEVGRRLGVSANAVKYRLVGRVR
jgi:ribosomal protein L37AE/L43A